MKVVDICLKRSKSSSLLLYVKVKLIMIIKKNVCILLSLYDECKLLDVCRYI